MATITNPILRGFNPDPSICRVGEDFYIANSTFEWFPGVQISHSRDLVHWQVVSRPLSRLSQLNMAGAPNSGGIWAPCLTWHDRQFYLIFTDVKRWTGNYKDCHNYLVTAPSIEGPWSEPIYLNSSGFDPSLFHDDDGKKYLVNMQWDHRPGHNNFAGILIQEFDPRAKKMTGPVTKIFEGTKLGLVEGPHLYRKDGFYYLMTAEGGTFLTHAVSIARSKVITGPYEVMPGNPLLTTIDDPANPLQSAGHASMVQTSSGDWILAHLCRRPVVKGRSVLGRETALQSLVWDAQGWPRLAQGGNHPLLKAEVPSLPPHPFPPKPLRDDFNSPDLGIEYQSLRIPLGNEELSLTERPGFLRLKGRESIVSQYRQALVARRQEAFRVTASTVMEFEPDDFQQMAGLVAFYNTDAFYYLFVTTAPHAAKALGVMMCEKGNVSFPVEKEIDVSRLDRIHLKVEIDHARLRFYYGEDGKNWHPVGWEYDASILSDEHALPCGFTGNFVGLACQDITGRGRHADFDWFEYTEE